MARHRLLKCHYHSQRFILCVSIWIVVCSKKLRVQQKSRNYIGNFSVILFVLMLIVCSIESIAKQPIHSTWYTLFIYRKVIDLKLRSFHSHSIFHVFIRIWRQFSWLFQTDHIDSGQDLTIYLLDDFFYCNETCVFQRQRDNFMYKYDPFFPYYTALLFYLFSPLTDSSSVFLLLMPRPKQKKEKKNP